MVNSDNACQDDQLLVMPDPFVRAAPGLGAEGLQAGDAQLAKVAEGGFDAVLNAAAGAAGVKVIGDLVDVRTIFPSSQAAVKPPAGRCGRAGARICRRSERISRAEDFARAPRLRPRMMVASSGVKRTVKMSVALPVFAAAAPRHGGRPPVLLKLPFFIIL